MDSRQSDKKNPSLNAVTEKDNQSTESEYIPPEIRTSEGTILLSKLLAEKGAKMHYSKTAGMCFFRLDGKEDASSSSSEEEQSKALEEKQPEALRSTLK